MVLSLLFCYCTWQLNHPFTVDQLLRFLQQHLITEDKNTTFYKSAVYIKFDKKFQDNWMNYN